MQQFYTASPMMSTLTDQLLQFLMFVLNDKTVTVRGPIHILEVGAGTGGTTVRLVEAPANLGITIQYTFTDIYPEFVAQAKRRFKKFPWMDFAVLNIEQAASDNFRCQYNIIVGANVVHATSNRTATCRRVRDMLKTDRFIVLSEITRPIACYDIFLACWTAGGGRRR